MHHSATTDVTDRSDDNVVHTHQKALEASQLAMVCRANFSTLPPCYDETTTVEWGIAVWQRTCFGEAFK